MTDTLASTFGAPLAQIVADQALPDATVAAERFPVTVNPHPASDEEHEAHMERLAFGEAFGDHMAVADWTLEKGWHDHRIQPFEALQLSPAAAVLHYSQTVFEGLKAFRWDDGSVWTFRPGFNSARLTQSAERIAVPGVELDDFIGAIVAMVRTDEKWVPTAENSSLYLRPFIIANEPFLGVRPAHAYQFLVISSPVGPFFKGGLNPVSIYVATDFHRSAPGGTGAAKTGGNYAASLLPQQIAAAKGFEQVCYLDAQSNTHLEELGGMNVFLATEDGRVMTPRLTGTILEGGTRGAIIQLLADRGIEVEQRDISLEEVVTGVTNGEISEMFACGTAALVTPIGRLGGEGFDLTLEGGEVAQSLYEELSAIQRGYAEDRHNWMYRLV